MTLSGEIPSRAVWNLGSDTRVGYGFMKGSGEDDEVAVSRILWALATNPKYQLTTYQIVTGTTARYTNGYQAVFELLLDGQPPLYPNAVPLGPL